MVYNWVKFTQYILYPPTCLLCRAPGHENLDICRACHRDLPWRRELPGASRREPEPDGSPWLDDILIPFEYAFPIDHLIKTFKYDGDLASGRLLADLLGRWAAGRINDEMLLIPVPSTRRRLRERGFEPTACLAGRLACRLPAGVARNGLHKRRETPRQSELSARRRRVNLRNAFRAGRLHRENPGGIIVDDVMTTGTTAMEAARTLRRAGYERVCVLAVARA